MCPGTVMGNLILCWCQNTSVIFQYRKKVISLYARGMSTRDVHDQIQDLYGIEMSAEMASKITDKEQ